MPFKKIYEDKRNQNVALPSEALRIANERRGQTPMARFLGQIVCDALGVGGIHPDGIPKREE